MKMPSSPPSRSSSSSRILKLVLKIAVSALCLWYVAGKISWQEAMEALSGANPAWLAVAGLAFVLSKVFSSIRLLIYFHDIDVPLDQSRNLRLYWLGMFYNLFLPGAISGDAYKVILLKSWFDTPYKKSGAAVLLDRISGMLALVVLLALFGWMVLSPLWQPLLVTAGALGGLIALRIVVTRWMKAFRNSYFSTLAWGLAVQGMQVLSVYAIMSALGLDLSQHAYIFLFLLSSIASVLPLTIGGLGIRELVFLEGAIYFGITESNAVLISLVFYLITLVCSLPGVYFVFRKP